jgi:hypothetical protein
VGEFVLRASASGRADRDGRAPPALRGARRHRSALVRFLCPLPENEFVYVYFARLKSQTRPDPAEIASLEFLSLRELSRRIERKPGAFTYWMKHYIRHHHGEIARHIRAETG